jgi:two-component system LytT family response regulator
MVKAIAVKNDTHILDLISSTVEAYIPNVDLVAAAGDIKTGIGVIHLHEPDLVILDIRLKNGSGFDLIDHFDKPDFKVIFISDHSDYAIKAIKYDAIDYLLKPLKQDELAQALRKVDDLIRLEEKLHALWKYGNPIFPIFHSSFHNKLQNFFEFSFLITSILYIFEKKLKQWKRKVPSMSLVTIF